MKPKLLLCLALVLSGGLCGCTTNRSAEATPKILPWVSFNGKYLLNRNQLWDVATGKKFREFAVPPQFTVSNNAAQGWGWVEAVAISPDGKKVLTVMNQYLGPERSGPGPVQLWDIDSGQKLLEFKPVERIDNAAFLPDGKRILTTSDGPKYPIQIWDAKTGQLLLTLHEWPVSILSDQLPSFSPDGRLIATEGYAGTKGRYHQTVNIWNSITGRNICTIEDATNSFFGLAQFSPDGNLIQTCCDRGFSSDQGYQMVTTIWDVKTGRRIRDLISNFEEGKLLGLTPDWREIIVCDGTNKVALWDEKLQKEIRQFTVPDSFPKAEDVWRSGKIAFSHDGKRIIIEYIDRAPDGGTQIIITLWNIETGELIKQFGNVGENGGDGQAVISFSPEGENFMLFDNNGKPELFDGATGTRLKILKDFQQP